VVEYVLRPDWWARLQVLLLASVIAPIVEETMFRGVLYRHLREASSRLGFVLSILVSAVLVSFVFAVIHPQGLEAVPLLMALAFAFCLMREWRGTLLPSMIAHGINNGLVLSLLIFAMGD
jgi:membrane protease YdiL (CAAX protease family)